VCAGHRVELSVGIKESEYSFRLLERLNEAIQQDPVEAAVVARNAILVVIIEGVNKRLPADARSAGRCRSLFGRVREKGYQGRSPWLVRCATKTARTHLAAASVAELSISAFYGSGNGPLTAKLLNRSGRKKACDLTADKQGWAFQLQTRGIFGKHVQCRGDASFVR
jgi:hypothetical protein